VAARGKDVSPGYPGSVSFLVSLLALSPPTASPALQDPQEARLQRRFVFKPKHSGFYSTTLDLLLQVLQALGVHILILTGIAGNICVLFTANDAYIRGYGLPAANRSLLARPHG
jgi:hypothetical protein